MKTKAKNQKKQVLRGTDLINQIDQYFGRTYDADNVLPGSSGILNIINDVNEDTIMGMVSGAEMDDAMNGPSLPETGREFRISHSKVRKALISTGSYTSSTADRVQELYARGLTVKEIAKQEHLSIASVQDYLPYSKTVYKLEDCSLEAAKVRDWRARDRERREVVREYKDGKAGLAEVLGAYQGCRVSLAPGQRFVYKIENGKLIIPQRGEDDLRYEIAELVAGATDEYVDAIYKKIGLMENAGDET